MMLGFNWSKLSLRTAVQVIVLCVILPMPFFVFTGHTGHFTTERGPEGLVGKAVLLHGTARPAPPSTPPQPQQDGISTVDMIAGRAPGGAFPALSCAFCARHLCPAGESYLAREWPCFMCHSLVPRPMLGQHGPSGHYGGPHGAQVPGLPPNDHPNPSQGRRDRRVLEKVEPAKKNFSRHMAV